MRNLKLKLLALLVLLFGVFIYVSCEKEDEKLTNEQDFKNFDIQKNSFDPEYIGNMHNEFLDRVYSEFFPKYQPKDGILLEINELMDFIFAQPEASTLTTTQKTEIRNLFLNFESNGEGYETFVQFESYLEENVSEIYDAPFVNIIEGKTIRGITREVIEVHSSIKRNSEIYWAENDNTRACISCADAAGGAWGFLFGGVGAWVAGSAASVLAELIHSCEGPTPVFDGVIHTPKDC